MRHYVCLPSMSVEADGFAITTVQDEHIERIRQWRNAQMDILRQSAPITPQQQSDYYAAHVWPAMASQHPANILLGFLEAGQLIGYGGLVHIAWEHRRAEVSFLLDPQLTRDAGQYSRYFAAYLTLLKRLAFHNLDFYRLFAETYALRSDHIAVLEANGFSFEGRMKGHVWIDGRPVDSLLHGCMNDEA